MASDPRTPDSRPALTLPVDGVHPVIDGSLAFAGARCVVLGRARLGRGVHLGEDCVIRADGHTIDVGDDAFLSARTTLHIVHGTLPTHVGRSLTTGMNAIVHACTIGDNCVVERDAVVLDGAIVENEVLIEAGATVLPGRRLATGWIYAGNPAKALRPLEPGELQARAAEMRRRDAAEAHLPTLVATQMEGAFVAATAGLRGRVAMGAGSSLFFSCVADAGRGTISIGENTNVQDNSVIESRGGDTLIGRDTTIGHNVAMSACVIGERCLIGMGAMLAPGTVVQPDVFVAAGAHTTSGQTLVTGWLWGGRPARKLAPMDEAKAATVSRVVETYKGYARMFDRLQRDAEGG